MEKKYDNMVEKNQNPGQADQSGTKQPPTKKRGLIAGFFAWIAKGTQEAAKDGSLCNR